jgi:predicted metalloprotease with PDZ domain
VLDLMIRSGSGGARSLDDAMRALSERFTIERGFTGLDVEHAVADACACDAHPFFDRYVRTAGALDFDRWLGLVGMRMTVTWTPALSNDGTPAPDVRFSASAYRGDSTLRLNVWFPAAPLGRAGFHTGDRIASVNGGALRDAAAFRDVVRQLRIGDTLRVAVRRASTTVERAVIITGYDRPTVTLAMRADATVEQRRLLQQWMAGR